jgi:hypothetical protein
VSSKRQASKGKKINPHFWVFCEGETEEAYVRYLRAEYRLPLEIIPKIAGCDINSRYIQSYKKGKPTHKKDKDFLVYDADVPETLERLIHIPSVLLITSNPAIELWFLLHYKNQTAQITEDECIRQLSNRNHNNYKKGFIDTPLKTRLREKCKEAAIRSKNLILHNNPSTNMHVFVECLERAKKEKI